MRVERAIPEIIGGNASRSAGAATGLARKYSYHTYHSFAAIPRDAWERMLPGEPENADFYRVVEHVPPPGFELGAIAGFDGTTMVAAAPLFRVAYRYDTPLQGRMRQIGDWIHAHFPRLISLPVIGIGSPMSDNCAVGFAPELSASECAQAFDGMLHHLADEARHAGSALLAIKALDRLAELLEEPLARHGYKRVTSVPLVMLDLPFRSLDQYLDSLPEKTGCYFRRKMKSANKVRIEYRRSITGLEARINELFENTLQQSSVDYGDFERLHPDYFAKVVHELGERAQFMLCWRGDQLLSFQLFLVGENRVLAKQIGMQYPEARELNLYFVNWLKLIDYAIEHRIPRVEMGATTYATKLLFGGYLDRRWLHFRFRGAIANALLNPLASLFDFERNDPELKKLGCSGMDLGPRSFRSAHAALGMTPQVHGAYQRG